MNDRGLRRVTWAHLADFPYTGCDLAPCTARAECLLDEEPLCLDCAELILERIETPEPTKSLLPVLTDR